MAHLGWVYSSIFYLVLFPQSPANGFLILFTWVLGSWFSLFLDTYFFRDEVGACMGGKKNCQGAKSIFSLLFLVLEAYSAS